MKTKKSKPTTSSAPKAGSHQFLKVDDNASRVERTRQKILISAYEIMCKKGVAQTSIMDVAKASKTSHPLVTYHFKDIDQLYFGVLSEVLADLRTCVVQALNEDHKNATDLLKAYVDAYFIWGKRYPDKLRLWIYFYYLATVNSNFQQFNDEVRSVGRQRIEGFLHRGIAYGEFKKMTPAETQDMSAFIQSLITGNIVMASNESSYSFDEASRITFEFCKRALIQSN